MTTRPGEGALLGDLHGLAVEHRLDAPFDDQRAAVADLGALQLDVGTDDEAAALTSGCRPGLGALAGAAAGTGSGRGGE
jgi:hypothetical protein